MLKFIGTIIAAGGLLLASVDTASAHGRADHGYNLPNHYRAIGHRHSHMPAWLRHKKGFRAWYFRSSLRYTRQIAWWQLYEIYRWERRYDRRHHYPASHKRGRRDGRRTSQRRNRYDN